MEENDMIPADEFCKHYNIEFSFIELLGQYELIKTPTLNSRTFIYQEQLNQLEKFIRMHYDLDINMEGIEVIINLLEKMKDMHKEIDTLKTRLTIYENRKQD
jgi:hypothetical protein